MLNNDQHHLQHSRTALTLGECSGPEATVLAPSLLLRFSGVSKMLSHGLLLLEKQLLSAGIRKRPSITLWKVGQEDQA